MPFYINSDFCFFLSGSQNIFWDQWSRGPILFPPLVQGLSIYPGDVDEDENLIID